MKVPELYINELSLAIMSLKQTFDMVEESAMRDMKRTNRAMFFRPWARRQIAVACAIRMQVALEMMKELHSLQQKFLDSTGVDEDMRPVTLKQILKIEDNEPASN